MMNSEYSDLYANAFGYKRKQYKKDETIYMKKLEEGFIVFKIKKDNKYVNFFFNDKQKTFKVGDMLLSILEEKPLAWELENDNV